MSAYLKDFFRQIAKSPARFISLLFITALGTAIYSGVSFASPDMRATAVEYFNDRSLSDLHIMSTAGFNNDDIAEIESSLYEFGKFNNFTEDFKIDAMYSADMFIQNEKGTAVAKIYSIPQNENTQLNVPVLTDGRMPSKSGECMVDSSVLKLGEGKKIGDTIVIYDDADSDVFSVFKKSEYTITGVCSSPLYITAVKGNTSKGSGFIAGYMYIPEEDFVYSDYDIYTDIYIRKKGYSNYFSSEYDSYTEQLADVIKEAGERRNKELGYGTWYIEDSSHNSGYSGFEQDTRRLAAIAAVFPIIFFLVAALVGLTTMARMVEEHRNEVGIYKSLGYSKYAIIWKFAGYALMTSLTGSCAGFFSGRFALSFLIFDAYSTLYRLPDIIYSDNPMFLISGVSASIACLVGATLAVGIGELTQQPAHLMRPKPPAKGQRILLERVSFIWKHLNFTKKVTARNLMRYKQRFFMTVIGIAGCTALLITGFGLKDSIGDMAPLQFGGIYKYDAQILFQENNSEDSEKTKQEFLDLISPSENNNIISHTLIYQNTMTAQSQDSKEFVNTYIIVPFDASEMEEYIDLHERKNGNKLFLEDDGVIITEKISNLLKLKKGDDIILKDSENNIHTLKISGITEHYVEHYVYFSPDLYEKVFGEKAVMNTYILKMRNTDKETRDKLSSLVLAVDDNSDDFNILYINYTQTSRENVADMVDVMDFVVYVLIISAGGLAFTVLFNLTNINIAERTRELATIRVLGFHMGETASYIYRENAMLTFFGIIVGCVFGYYLHLFVTVTAEVELVMFGRNIHFASYIYSVILTIVFAVIVNAVMLIRLKKINMVESLKSVE